MRRTFAIAGVVLVWAVTVFALHAGAAGEVLTRSEARATAVHGFYDHEDLFPVSIFNLSVPFAESRFEPGPASEARGSLLWEPEVADLGTIFCFLSGNQFCSFPAYPFQAHATHPGTGEEIANRGPAIDAEGAPVAAGAADQRAVADASGAAADSEIARFGAIPMSAEQAAAASSLAAAIGVAEGSLGVPDPPSPWIVEIGNATSSATISQDGARVTAASAATGVSLAGGLISIDAIRARVAVTPTDGSAEASAGAIRVGSFEARATGEGLEIVDARLDASAAAALTAALDAALAEIGFDLTRGREAVTAIDGGNEGEAFALSLSFRRELLPEQLPAGTTGADVLEVPLAFASAAVVQNALPEPEEPAAAATDPVEPAVLPAAATPADGSPPAASSPPDAGSPPAPAPAPAAPAPEPVVVDAAPVARVVALGIPLPAVLGIGAAAFGMLLGLTGLKVLEVLKE